MKTKLTKFLFAMSMASFILVMGLTCLVAYGGTEKEEFENKLFGKGGEAGEIYCSEYSDLIGEVIDELYTIKKKKIRRVSKLIDRDKLAEAYGRLYCTPVLDLDRTARTNIETGVTSLLVAEESEITPWQKLSMGEKLRLATHEIAVLAGLERGDRYTISRLIVDLLEKHTRLGMYTMDYNSDVRGHDVEVNYEQGYLSIVKPFLSRNGKRYYFGHEKRVPYQYIKKYRGELEARKSIYDGIKYVIDRQRSCLRCSPLPIEYVSTRFSRSPYMPGNEQAICKFITGQWPKSASLISSGSKVGNGHRYASITREGTLEGVYRSGGTWTVVETIDSIQCKY